LGAPEGLGASPSARHDVFFAGDGASPDWYFLSVAPSSSAISRSSPAAFTALPCHSTAFGLSPDSQ
jgi:hypothetical protein